MTQLPELAWDITDWDSDADISFYNVRYNILHTFVSGGLPLPSAIICRSDQERSLLKEFEPGLSSIVTNIKSIHTPFGEMKLKVLPIQREEISVVRK